MKKSIYLFICFALLLTSCDESLLGEQPLGAETEEVAVQDSSDLFRLLNYAYAGLPMGSEVGLSTVFTDEVGIAPGNGGQGLINDGSYLFTMNSANPYAEGLWSGYYFVLSYANRVITYSERITPEDAADELYIKNLVAQARTLRAHSHLQLLSYFSVNPADNNALGVMLSNSIPVSSTQKPRVSNSLVYSLIDSDLTEAIQLFTDSQSSPNVAYANINFAKAVRARSYAQRKDYTNLLSVTNDIITSLESSNVFLSNGEDYRNMFHNDSDLRSEAIFKRKNLVGGAQVGSIWASRTATLNGAAFYEMGRSLYNKIDPSNAPNPVTVTVTAINGVNLTVGTSSGLQVNDMVVFNNSLPLNATLNTNTGTATIPVNSAIAGKVYFVRTINNSTGIMTLSQEYNPTTVAAVNFAAASTLVSPTSPLVGKATTGDARYSTLIHFSSIVDPNYITSANYLTTDRLIIRKYPGAPGKGNLVNDYKICRLSEIYLLKAEAQIGLNQLSDAAITIKQVLDKRFVTPRPLPAYASVTDAYKALLNERRIELAYEGFRFLDMKRLGPLANENVVRDPRDCETRTGACELSSTSYKFALPIPNIEFNGNTAILGQQNPGY